jgi:hypothetical protein
MNCHKLWLGVHALLAAGAACSQSHTALPSDDAGAEGTVDGASQSPLDAAAVDVYVSPNDGGEPDASAIDGSSEDGGLPTWCITPTTPQTCRPPEMTVLPICKLSQTGCVDPANPTHFAASAVYYEVNSPLWSDNAAKSRAFVLPDGGTIHVKDCMPDASVAQLAECVSPQGIPNGWADTGKWVFPVGTVMIKNFIFDGKLVETRLFMHVDAATAALIQNGTEWVGYNYAWNEAQTEATALNDERTSVSFDTGHRTVTWNYPNWLDCINCHADATGTLGPETDQMNRIVDGGNQIDDFVARGLFDDTAPTKPYTTALVEPYANAALGLTGPPPGATVEQEARSYLSANCGFCHRPDVNDQNFDLRYSLSLAQTGLCGQVQQNGIPGMTNQTYLDFDPSHHEQSALWIRMNIPIPASDPDEENDVGRMPPVASFVVDTQATAIVGSWIDSVARCPDAGAD